MDIIIIESKWVDGRIIVIIDKVRPTSLFNPRSSLAFYTNNPPDKELTKNLDWLFTKLFVFYKFLKAHHERVSGQFVEGTRK